MAGIGVGANITGATALVNTFDNMRTAAASAKWVVGTTVEYSVFVEFGTTRMAAQPYLRPAVEAAQRNAGRIFAQAASLDAFVADLALYIEAEAKRRCPVDTGNLRGSIRAEKVS